MSFRTYHDPLHHGISLDSDKPEECMAMELIDSMPFQRLRRIKQLGPAFLTFHGAESSRFTHSLGVFHIARKAFRRLLKLDPGLKEFQGILYAAALLHDIGHGPLSHTGEEMFGLQHERWSAYVIKNHPAIKSSLDSFREGTSIAVAELLCNGNSRNSIIKDLISSQLDCDRLDYLLRDSYSTGTSYGKLDLDRIITALSISPDGKLAIEPKGLMAVEHYLVVRNLMYRSVYNHRLNEVCSWMLEQVIRIARKLGPNQIWADKHMAIWLWHPDEIDLKTFLANDDNRTTYHLLRWEEDAPEPLSTICRRFLRRDLLKALNIDQLNNEEQLEALAKARSLTEKQGEDPDFLCGLRHQQFHSYEPYKGGLRLWDGNNLRALEQVSPLIQGLIDPARSAWLIHPKEIHQDLKKELTV